jgi:hypothetical protein
MHDYLRTSGVSPLIDTLKQEVVHFSVRKEVLVVRDFHKLLDGLRVSMVLGSFVVRKCIEHALL